MSQTKISVVSCTDEDIPACFEVVSESFGHDAPFVDAYFPSHDTSFGRENGSKRLLAWKQASEGSGSCFLKATDGNRIIGLGIWSLMKQPQTDRLEEVEPDIQAVWPDKKDAEFMRRLWKGYVISRNQAITRVGGEGVWVLELLAVHPDAQRRGAGSALVKWGTSVADRDGLEAVIESTPIGRRTYEKCGFRAEKEVMELDPGEEFAERKKPTLTFMWRGKQGRSAN